MIEFFTEFDVVDFNGHIQTLKVPAKEHSFALPEACTIFSQPRLIMEIDGVKFGA